MLISELAIEINNLLVNGILFTDDKPTIQAMIGSGIIAGSIAILRYFE